MNPLPWCDNIEHQQNDKDDGDGNDEEYEVDVDGDDDDECRQEHHANVDKETHRLHKSLEVKWNKIVSKFVTEIQYLILMLKMKTKKEFWSSDYTVTETGSNWEKLIMLITMWSFGIIKW